MPRRNCLSKEKQTCKTECPRGWNENALDGDCRADVVGLLELYGGGRVGQLDVEGVPVLVPDQIRVLLMHPVHYQVGLLRPHSKQSLRHEGEMKDILSKRY